jgi:hypothetical protein
MVIAANSRYPGPSNEQSDETEVVEVAETIENPRILSVYDLSACSSPALRYFRIDM